MKPNSASGPAKPMAAEASGGPMIAPTELARINPPLTDTTLSGPAWSLVWAAQTG